MFHPNHTPKGEDPKDPMSRFGHFFNTFKKHRPNPDPGSNPNFLEERMAETGSTNMDELIDYESGADDMQQLIHQTEGHVNAPSPLDDCDECDFLASMHKEGSHGEKASVDNMLDREHCWHCKNENKK
jgi:hypothetical protein